MEIRDFFLTKRTYRKFEQIQIPGNVLNDCMLAAQMASSGGNRQGLKYIVIENGPMVKAVNDFVKWAAYLPRELGQPNANETPMAFIAVLKDTNIGVSDTDAGIAIADIQTAAWYHGVGSCIMGAIDRPAIKELLSIEDAMELHSVIALGYPKKASTPVAMSEDGNIKYYVDANGDTFVPKRSIEDIARFI